MLDKALTIFFVILIIMAFTILLFNGVLNHLVDGVIQKKENFVSQITGLETSDEKNNLENDSNVNKRILLKEHTEKGYNQNNFQVANDIPLSQTSYAYYINKYYINKNINKSVDEDMEILDSVNINKPDYLYDGIWRADYVNKDDYQRVNWVLTHPINESRGKLGVNKLFEQMKMKPMPNDMKYMCCETNPQPFYAYDKLCEKNQKGCDDEFKNDDIVCFAQYLDPMTNDKNYENEFLP